MTLLIGRVLHAAAASMPRKDSGGQQQREKVFGHQSDPRKEGESIRALAFEEANDRFRIHFGSRLAVPYHCCRLSHPGNACTIGLQAVTRLTARKRKDTAKSGIESIKPLIKPITTRPFSLRLLTDSSNPLYVSTPFDHRFHRECAGIQSSS